MCKFCTIQVTKLALCMNTHYNFNAINALVCLNPQHQHEYCMKMTVFILAAVRTWNLAMVTASYISVNCVRVCCSYFKALLPTAWRIIHVYHLKIPLGNLVFVLRFKSSVKCTLSNVVLNSPSRLWRTSSLSWSASLILRHIIALT
jgi:hypothetical protein